MLVNPDDSPKWWAGGHRTSYESTLHWSKDAPRIAPMLGTLAPSIGLNSDILRVSQNSPTFSEQTILLYPLDIVISNLRELANERVPSREGLK